MLCAAPSPPPPPHAQVVGHGFLLRRTAQPTLLGLMRGKLQGLVVGVHARRGSLWSEGFGGLHPRSPHRLGLVTGLFTALAARQLAAEGRLRLQQPLRRLLPQLRLAGESAEAPVRVAHLLDHSSGLPAQALAGQWSTQSPESLLATRWPLLSTPGSTYATSSLGHGLLGLAIQQAAGRPFAALMNEQLLPSWGLHQARYESRRPDGPEPPCRDLAAQGLSASAEELGGFLVRLHQPPGTPKALPLPASALAAMLAPHHPQAEGLKSGEGWMLESLGELQLRGVGPVAHLGSSHWGDHAQVVHLPQAGLSVVVLGRGPGQQARQAVNDCAHVLLSAALEVEGIPQRRAPELVASGDFAADEAASWAGEWLLPTGLVRLEAKGPQLVAAAGWPFALRALPGGGAQLGFSAWGWGHWPLRGISAARLRPQGQGDRLRLVLEQEGAALALAVRAPATSPHPAWRARLGRYRFQAAPGESPALPHLSLESEGPHLLLRAHFADPPEARQVLALGGQDPQEAKLLGTGFGAGESLQAHPDGSLSAFGGHFLPEADAARP